MEQHEFAELKAIAELFDIEGSCSFADVISNGNINSTYKVGFESENADGLTVVKQYVLQRVNTYVFKNPEQIMSNIAAVTKHIEAKTEKAFASDEDKTPVTTLHFYENKDSGKIYYDDGNGNFWRICDYIDSVTINESSDLSVLEALGRAFGDFQNMLSDFDADSLYETIPDFHNTKKRLDTLFDDVRADKLGRAAGATLEIGFILGNRALASGLSNMFAEGKIPARVTHNDTKLNNVLFDSDGKRPIAIIDLDTVMPGLAASDYGDAVRFACSSAAEDEKDIEKVYLDMDKFKAFTKGFVESTKDKLTGLEIDTLVLGAISITIELASRFLDDYLTGDKYFKTLYEGHNLVRAKCQLALAKDMLKKRAEMEEYVKSIK